MSGAWAAGPAKDKGTWLDMRASELIGKHVVNPEGKSLGKAEDLIVDLVYRANWPFQPPLVRGVIVAQDGRKGDEPKLTVSPRSLTFGKSE